MSCIEKRGRVRERRERRTKQNNRISWELRVRAKREKRRGRCKLLAVVLSVFLCFLVFGMRTFADPRCLLAGAGHSARAGDGGGEGRGGGQGEYL